MLRSSCNLGPGCKELRKEKDMLRESQSQSFDLIKRLELHVKSLSEARNEDKKHIQKLERELMNCSQEIEAACWKSMFCSHPIIQPSHSHAALHFRIDVCECFLGLNPITNSSQITLRIN
ncbi:hypothetical protein Pint_16203 [Pistacia integerrima]|uniref:Uncharacterized protein n=1 Tax=Pistacia integerrima TaxID=434235 RepID=A0ACC0ZD56_9ROSI|nr:hypothetical protein Pint_16203 [Pistacia integerrima]